MAENRFLLESIKIKQRKEQGIKCVFISYQRNDVNACKKIADYILALGIDIYFDEYDKDLKFHLQTNNPRGVTNAIRKGINNSSHMLCVRKRVMGSGLSIDIKTIATLKEGVNRGWVSTGCCPNNHRIKG